ncbi:MAG: EutN/CcmL family microcompartment protein [Ignavibacteriaceae bacterium]
MKLGKVIGNVVSTRKEGNLGGLKIMVVTYLDENLYLVIINKILEGDKNVASSIRFYRDTWKYRRHTSYRRYA